MRRFSPRGDKLAHLPPALAARLEELQDAVRGLGEELGAALAAQNERETEQTLAAEHAKQAVTIEPASATRGYRAAEVARRLGIHQQTLWKWCREGRFPKGIKVGPMTTIWTEAMIAEVLAEKMKETTK